MPQSFKNILSPLASLRLTVVLLLLSMVLIFAGTTIQAEMGIWDVQRIYFHSWFTVLDFRLFFPLWDWGMTNMPGALPFPGGYTLIALLLVNLLAAHSVRFKMSWKRSGIILIHGGLILLIIGEVVTAEGAREGNMVIDTGSSTNFIQDTREIELAITDPSNPEHDKEVVIPVGRLRAMGTIEHPELPFSLTVDRFYANTDLAGPMQNVPGAESLATVGTGVGMKLMEAPKSAGTQSVVDMPSAFVTLKNAGQSMGTYLLTTMELLPQFPPVNLPQILTVADKEYWIHLRFRRTYKPFTLHLLKFSHDRYQGTNVAKNFSSLVRLVDPANNVDREVLIWMNHPLRYAGETFYQSSFKPGDQTTILQVVNNPGWVIPYISCILVSLGMLVHFGMHLIKFLSTVTGKAMQPVPAPAIEPMTGEPVMGRLAAEPATPKRNGKHKGGTALKEPLVAAPAAMLGTRAKVSMFPAIVATAICALYLVGTISPRPIQSSFDMDAFARVPISHDGRTMPMDSLARNSLRIMSGKSTLDVGTEKRPAISFLLDVFAQPDRAANYNVFRIDHPDIRSLLNLPETEAGGGYRSRYSFDDIASRFDTLREQYVRAQQVKPADRDLYQRKVLELVQHVMLFDKLAAKKELLVSPPMAGEEWRMLGEMGGGEGSVSDPGAAAFLAMASAKAQGMSREFNEAATAYRSILQERFPGMVRKLDLEVFYNRAQPFMTSMALYVIVFLLAAFSWLKWHAPLARAALWVLLLTFSLHTLALIARIYIQGRPPITNLYGTAIFIGWAAVAMAIGFELVYRNGIASAVAGLIGFPTLIVAHYLAGTGDTMQMLQAVLDTNFWLATHVTIINFGYSATFFAGGLAIVYVVGGLLAPGFNAGMKKNLYRMVYGVMCFAILFSFVGTVLGGIWADQSWGRFWGWDPKENGAVLLVFWNAVCLHARWAGMVKERGFMLLAILGNIVTAWSWFGTNMLGVGLHSYGFMDSALFWLLAFYAVNLGVVFAGLIPMEMWRSNQEVRGFQIRPA